jgi:Gamma-glutamyl cyclotransferase, AIG2-like
MAPQVLYRVIYGTPEPEAWQIARLSMRSAILHEYRRQRVKYADYPAIIPKRLATVRGVFVTGLSDMDVRRLDLFEGSMYERQKVTVKLLKNVNLQENVPDSELAGLEGKEAEAETYVWRDPVESLEDREWDFDDFKKKKMREWAGLPGSTGTEVDEGFAFVDEYSAATPRSGSTDIPNTRRHGSGDMATAGAGKSARDSASQGTVSRTRGQGIECRAMNGKATGGHGGGDQGNVGRGRGVDVVRGRGSGRGHGRGRGAEHTTSSCPSRGRDK